MKQNAIETILGTVVLLVAILFVVFAYNTADLQKVEGYTIYADFGDSTGLQVGGDVKISGVKIGSIVELDLNPENYRARATMTILDSIQLPEDTVGVINSEGLMGGKFLALEPGGSAEFLEDGDELYDTQYTPGLEKLIGQAIYNFQGGEANNSEKSSSTDNFSNIVP